MRIVKLLVAVERLVEQVLAVQAWDDSAPHRLDGKYNSTSAGVCTNQTVSVKEYNTYWETKKT